MKLIGIDPGHGGTDPGAIGPAGTKEKDITLVIAEKLAWYLQRAGLNTFLTREEDVSKELLTRSALINNMKCDLVISVHINSCGESGPSYIATFIQATGGEAEKLAQVVQKQMVAVMGWQDGGVRVDNLHMTRETNMPAILVECGFISNPDEEDQLNKELTQDRFAAAIAQGFKEYLGIQDNPAPDPDTSLHMGKAALNIDGTAYVPLRGFLDALEVGTVTGWDGSKQEVAFTVNGKQHVVTIGGDEIKEG